MTLFAPVIRPYSETGLLMNRKLKTMTTPTGNDLSRQILRAATVRGKKSGKFALRQANSNSLSKSAKRFIFCLPQGLTMIVFF